MSKHTPGPWEVLNGLLVFSALGADSGDGVKATTSDGWMIADCGGCETNSEIGPVELGPGVLLANARLIAAAPELLVVAQEFLEALAEQGILCECGEADCRTTRARAAIAKARGES
ncbi:hypothetical protein EXN22_16350 [Pseudomonas tructae]|uniref:Uncharacterized protein n=1 Tax=Pseudomonas tructae TaxID=2518644 RepID=A0A411MK49_9PSED|nr:hypothetical protein [Pseudomonas tructae]QBF27186.1 hypothetical protein EXN22_16350 [Pseudomonas tructae]